MAEIDYVFIADFAKVQPNGTLTAVGVGWTHVEVRSLPTLHRVSVAGRVRAKLAEGAIEIRVSITAPGAEFTVQAEGSLEAGPDARPYAEGRIGHLFAVDLQLPLPMPGLYTVLVELADGDSREVKFEVVLPGAS